MLYPSVPQLSNSSTGFNLGATPVSVDSATDCNSWDFKDQWQDGVMQAQCVVCLGCLLLITDFFE